MSKRSPRSPYPTGGPPVKALKEDRPAGNPSDLPTRTRGDDQHNTEPPSLDEPSTEQCGEERMVGRRIAKEGDAATATPERMAPESAGRAGIGGKEDDKECIRRDCEHKESDILRRERADIDLYREHFSGYKEDRAHLSSNPFIESDERLEGAEHRHDFPRVKQEGTNTPETRAGPAVAYTTRATTQDEAPSQHDTQSPGMLGHTPSAARRQPDNPAHSAREDRAEETHGDVEGTWTERVHNLQDFAEARGADLRSMSPDEEDPPTFSSDAPGHRRRSRRENDVHGREATMALYAYPRLDNGRQFFDRMPEARREELERVRRDLKDMEKHLHRKTRERIDEVAATLDTGSSSARPAPPRRG